ncbi:MAG: FAD-dependent oxidoreductase, partial [Actinomycetota bacterium]|nr:FAD-dependent oxidoreductase [Actinomycetota bacterium]
HARQGTRLITGAVVARLVGDPSGRVCALVTGEGRELPADLVVVGVGVTPRTELADATGLAVEPGPSGGVVVDEHLRTSDPRISAVGDCAAFPARQLGGWRVRVESVQNAVDQAATVAERLTGTAAPYTAVPWFWSDQFDLHLQIAGLAVGADDTVVTGDVAAAAFSVLCFREDALVAVESVSRPADHLAARKLLAAGARIDRATAAAPGFDLVAHLRTLRRRLPRAS